MVLGGAVQGGKIVGRFPSDIMDSGAWSIGRGRMMPSTSWDVIWNAICEWMGIETEEEMLRVIPNLKNTYGKNSYGEEFTSPIRASELFKA